MKSANSSSERTDMARPTLRGEDLPSLFHAADVTSLKGQRRFVRGTAFRLGCAVAAAICAALAFLEDTAHHRLSYYQLGGVFFFTCVLGTEIWLLTDRPDRRWYDGRALAESAKTLAWRYAVGGLPFGKNMIEPEREFGERLTALLEDAPEAIYEPTTGVSIVTSAMVHLRSLSLSERRDAYISDRVMEQQAWYAAHAAKNNRRSDQWRLLLIAAEVCGVFGALATGLRIVSFDLGSVFAAVVAAGVAWLAVRQHDQLARAYTFASHELAAAAARLQAVPDEKSWATEVADTEEAISREHTMWRAARTGGMAIAKRPGQ
ncbi:MAG: DUF4231 domain-containing protein [Micromonosporaceae bacterium]